MADLKTIKRRIGSVKNTQQITKAMKMVAAARLRKAQDTAIGNRYYAHSVERMLSNMMQGLLNDPAYDNDFFNARNAPPARCLIIITSDKGLAGSLNTALIRKAHQRCNEILSAQEKPLLVIVGRKGHEYFRRRDFEILHYFRDFFLDFSFNACQRVSQFVTDAFLDEKFREVDVLFNHFQSPLVQRPTMKRFLPIDRTQLAAELKGFLAENKNPDKEVPGDLILEPNKPALIKELLERTIDVAIYHSFLEAVASEHGARMTAMDAATKNAGDLIGRLTIQYNRARQAAITTELMEVISGAEALEA